MTFKTLPRLDAVVIPTLTAVQAYPSAQPRGPTVRPDHRDPAGVEQPLLPAYGAAMRGSSKRPHQSQAAADRVLLREAASSRSGSTIEVAAIAAQLARLSDRLDAQQAATQRLLDRLDVLDGNGDDNTVEASE